jgi:hypothetical protein
MSPILPLLMLFLLICRGGAAELPPDAQTTIDREAAQEAQLRTELDAKVAKLHSDLVARLKKSQDAAMHRGDLDGAEAIKARIVSLQPKTAPPEPMLSDLLVGTFHFAFMNGHAGGLGFEGGVATDMGPGIQGTVKVAEDDSKAVISWANGTCWTVTQDHGKLTLQASDGQCVLEKNPQ